MNQEQIEYLSKLCKHIQKEEEHRNHLRKIEEDKRLQEEKRIKDLELKQLFDCIQEKNKEEPKDQTEIHDRDFHRCYFNSRILNESDLDKFQESGFMVEKKRVMNTSMNADNRTSYIRWPVIHNLPETDSSDKSSWFGLFASKGSKN